MPKGKTGEAQTRRRAPAKTPEGRENQVIALAYDLAEKQIREGTASSQIITHFLKMGSSTGRLEKEILKEQKKLVTAKTKSFETGERLEVLYTEAVNAMRHYSGQDANED